MIQTRTRLTPILLLLFLGTPAISSSAQPALTKSKQGHASASYKQGSRQIGHREVASSDSMWPPFTLPFGKLSSALATCWSDSEAHARSDTRLDAVRDRMRGRVDGTRVASIAAAVAVEGEIIWTEACGIADRENGIPATPDTAYDIGSISKPFTATGLMVLVQDGLIDLDRPVNDYLGRARLRAFVGDASGATVRLVMEHRAGLPMHATARARARGALKPAPPSAFPAPEFVGMWKGTITTWTGRRPIAMDIRPDGSFIVQFAAQPKTALINIEFQHGELNGSFAGTIPTPDARRDRHTVYLDRLIVRGHTMRGTALADGGAHFALPSYIELRRQSSRN